MNLPIIFRPAAERDFRETFEWYEQCQRGLGDAFEDEVAQALERVQAHPLAYPRLHGPIRRALIRRFPHGIFYLIEPHRIIVVAVLHGRRDPSIARRRR